MSLRDCSKTSCAEPAVATLTFVYADSTAVIGALAREREPHTYDLCARHAASFTAPQGWTVIVAPTPLRPEDDLLALAKVLAETESPAEGQQASAADRPVMPRRASGAAPGRAASGNSPSTSTSASGTSERPRHLKIMRNADDQR